MSKVLEVSAGFFCCPEKRAKWGLSPNWTVASPGQPAPLCPLFSAPLSTLLFMPSKAQMQKSRSYAQLHAKSKVLWVRHPHSHTFKYSSCLFVWGEPQFFVLFFLACPAFTHFLSRFGSRIFSVFYLRWREIWYACLCCAFLLATIQKILPPP